MDAAHDDDAFHLFGPPPALASPTSYELFPQAATTSTASTSDAVDRVAPLAYKAAPTLEVRATAPPPFDGEENAGGDAFELFPMAADITSLAPSEFTATDMSDGRRSSSAATVSTTAAYSRAGSMASVVAAAAVLNGAPLSPVHKMSGNAVDIIAVRSTEDQYFCTPWHVRLAQLGACVCKSR